MNKMVILSFILLAGCANMTDAQRRAMGTAMAQGMQRQADAYNAAARAPIYQPPRSQYCYVQQTGPGVFHTVCN